MKPEPVPSTFASSSSSSMTSLEDVLGTLVNAMSLMETTDGEVSCDNTNA